MGRRPGRRRINVYHLSTGMPPSLCFRGLPLPKLLSVLAWSIQTSKSLGLGSIPGCLPAYPVQEILWNGWTVFPPRHLAPRFASWELQRTGTPRSLTARLSQRSHKQAAEVGLELIPGVRPSSRRHPASPAWPSRRLVPWLRSSRNNSLSPDGGEGEGLVRPGTPLTPTLALAGRGSSFPRPSSPTGERGG